MLNRLTSVLFIIGIIGGASLTVFIVIASARGPASPSTGALGQAATLGGILLTLISISVGMVSRSIGKVEARITRLEDRVSEDLQALEKRLNKRIDGAMATLEKNITLQIAALNQRIEDLMGD